MRKIALVKMQGGLGNQIFALNFINYLEMLNFNVYTSVKFYKNTQSSSINTERRDLHLDIDVLKLKIINNFYETMLNKIIKIRKSNSLYKRFVELFICFVNDENLNQNVSRKKFIFIFDGYWQNFELLHDKEGLIERLSLDKNFESLKKNEQKKYATMLHVRRKDYLNISEELNISYYKTALDHCRDSIGDLSYVIYTDDIKWVKQNPEFETASSIIEAKDTNTITDFLEMTSFKNFIISNSTYSYLAAYFGSNEKSTVVCPKPWFKNLEYTDYDKILNENWLLIKND
jgi:hypothetical protein